VDNTTETEYYVCPAKFITDNISEWFLEYSYVQKYPATAKDFRDQTNRYLTATNIYEHALSLNSLSHGGKSLS